MRTFPAWFPFSQCARRAGGHAGCVKIRSWAQIPQEVKNPKMQIQQPQAVSAEQQLEKTAIRFRRLAS
jgi:hypothetical protein